MKNCAWHDNKVYLFGRKVNHLKDLFESPILYLHSNIYISPKNEYEELKWDGSTEIQCKLVPVQEDQQIVFIPLIYTFDVFTK